MSSPAARADPDHRPAPRLAYERHGHGTPPLVLLHGIANTRAVWHDVIPELAGRRAVYAYDHRGHGESPHLGHGPAYTIDALVTDLADFLTAHGLTRAHVAGHSLGGAVALRFAAAHAGRVSSLILIDPVTAPPDDVSQAVSDRLLATVASHGMAGLAGLLDRLADFAPRTRSARQRARFRDGVARMDPAAFVGFTAALQALPSIDAALSTLDVATSVICAADNAAARRRAGDLARLLPRAVVRTVPGTAHAPHEEAPGDWLAAAEAHFAGLDAEEHGNGQDPDRQRVQRGPGRDHRRQAEEDRMVDPAARVVRPQR
ncbi:alpha/beta hydrolase [Dactylosporangium sp. NPDC051485]|uniref:alpha/beta fold hydrolase n=1 Tax=Dactylosporangium sp. NPDC051485 TaxID=3154846 RepID=UPI00343F6E89